MAKLVPLNWQIPITNPGGTPTPEFQRAWAGLQTATSDIPALDTSAEVSAVLDKIGATPGSLLRRTPAGWEIVTGAEGDLLVRGAVNWSPFARSGSASDYLAGDLSWQAVPAAADIQALLDSIGNTHGDVLFRGAAGWEALAAGTAGNFLQTQGAGADPVWASGGGGGGGGSILSPMYGVSQPSADSGAYATKGMTFYCGHNFTLRKVHAPISNTSAGVPIECRVFTTTNIAGSCTSSALGVASDTAAANKLMTFTFGTPISITAGSYYAVVLVATAAASDTTSIPLINCGNRVPSTFSDLVGAWRAPSPTSLGNFAAARIASRNPVNGTTISATTPNYLIHLEGTVP